MAFRPSFHNIFSLSFLLSRAIWRLFFNLSSKIVAFLKNEVATFDNWKPQTISGDK